MNWLAHLFLSEPCPAFRIGNVLPDLVKQAQLVSLPEAYQRGIRQHRRIDAFTDTHPVVRRSILRLGPEYRRYGGILTDMFYDHFLSLSWASFSPQPLPLFTAEVYASFDDHREMIPAEAHPPLDGMKDENWLGNYGEMEGLADTLRRIGLRFRRPVNLAAAMKVFQQEYAGIQEDFHEFFPALTRHLAER
ncbi:acyl carrier protein phosphodiesterase [Prosthecobacter dejongeii]|uniref:Acyl carrier protein phosphodiesterase n=1 Tax=Prosthecobacter dejongeii TaxID=48465 RepID=A0A7W7YJG4_9BACT|nr:ACP phosphodiesterase [Prosthecobacter dejongeii]MBB5037152.1 acyl carrier protein phosphodiesterase [Prosthecobacter dejongeii]